ncbi:ergothioneine biosynthesis protein EgtB [bacterium]|nr:MAG: ergothioneine biosynthesis protein EgtB [bacterium]
MTVHDGELQPARLAGTIRDAHERTLAMVADLADEQLSVPLIDDVNPFLWELGHVAFFYDVFVLRLLGSKAFLLAGADDLYDSFTVDHDDRWSLPLPSREQTLSYKSRVFEHVLADLEAAAKNGADLYLYRLALLHEDMHGEAFAYMRQTLGYPHPAPAPGARAATNNARGGGSLAGDASIPGGTFMLGAAPDGSFVFDNEKWAHPVEVPPFQIARAAVTNAEFAAFVEDRGYLRRELWSRQGWQWRARYGAAQPVYWEKTLDGWLRRDFDALVPLEPNAPIIHVNWYEAQAFCNWAGRRLPTEAEWELAASAEPTPDGARLTGRKRRYPWGDEPPTPAQANLDANLPGCADVGAFPAGESAFGCRQMLGNAWEWTASAFFPYPGYVVDTPYREYSAPWFGYRKVLKGGAWTTRARLVSNTYRNFFLPERRDVCSGFRTCAR